MRQSSGPAGQPPSARLPGKPQVMAPVLDSPMPRRPDRTRTIEREVRHRYRRLVRSVGEDVVRLRTDAGARRAQVAAAAGLDRSFLGRIEAGSANPSLETLVAIGVALGADLRVRFYPGIGPRLTDRHQARMVEAVLRRLDTVWRPHVEVPVSRPARGVVDAVFERLDDPCLVVAEFASILPRLEQEIRWAAQKADSIGSSTLAGDRPLPPVSKLLVLRSTHAMRELAHQFEATLRTAYPARTEEAVRSLLIGEPWPGDAVAWIAIDGDDVRLLDGPPRGVDVGR